MHQKPANRIFVAAQIGALVVTCLFIGDLFLNRQNELAANQDKAQRFNTMMAEHTARTFDAVNLLLREISGQITRNHPNWPRWSDDEGWGFLAQHHRNSMPQLRELLLYSKEGTYRFSSTPNNPQHLSILQGDVLNNIRNGRQSDPSLPLTEDHSYTLWHRLNDQAGNFTGLVTAMIEPLYLQEFCWPNRLNEDFESVLINDTGRIIATCRPSNPGLSLTAISRQYDEILFDGQLQGRIPRTGNHLIDGFLIAQHPIPGFPGLRMLTVIPQDSLLTSWKTRLFELGMLGFMIVGIILSGGYLMRRQLQKTAGMTQALEASHAELENRIALATEQLARQRDNAELASVAKSRFLAAASHDLRQPMHALSLFATDLQAQAVSGKLRDLPRLAEQIGTSTRLLSDLLDSLLDISRFDVAGIVPEINHFPLQSIFDRLFVAHRRNALDKKILLRFRFTRLWLHSDPALVERMLGNLLSNAVRYTQQGGRILVTARRKNGRVLIEVRDNGIGIPAEQQTAIFAEFYQVANPAREAHQGLGLGLSIVERLATALKIEIGLRSAINRGTNFSLLIQGGAMPDKSKPATGEDKALTMLYFIGHSEALKTAMRLAGSWNYRTAQQNSTQEPLPQLPYSTIVITELENAHAVRAIWPGKLTMILLVPEGITPTSIQDLPEGSLLCSLPLRPARLRALLQNTSSKSRP